MSSAPPKRATDTSVAGTKADKSKDAKAARLAEQLRANLKKRKSQQRGRKAAAEPDGDQQT